MKNFSRILLKLLAAGVIISAAALLIAYAGNPQTLLTGIFGEIGFYGSILTVWIFIIHVIIVLLSLLFNSRRS